MVPNFFPNLFYNKQGWVTNAKARVDFFIEKKYENNCLQLHDIFSSYEN